MIIERWFNWFNWLNVRNTSTSIRCTYSTWRPFLFNIFLPFIVKRLIVAGFMDLSGWLKACMGSIDSLLKILSNFTQKFYGSWRPSLAATVTAADLFAPSTRFIMMELEIINRIFLVKRTDNIRCHNFWNYFLST